MNSRDDAATRRQDVEICRTSHLHLEFVGAVTTPNDVRMRIDKTRHEDATARVEGRFIGVGGFEFSRCSDRYNLFIAHNDRAIFDDAERTKRFAALRSASEGEELRGGVDEHEV